jgi:hypothetical protein
MISGFFRTSLLVAAFLVAVSAPAKADYAVWTDVETGASVSFPDTWKQVNNRQPDDVITLALPSGEDEAVCRLRAREDRRFLVYPNQYRSDIQKVAYSDEALQGYLASYDNVNIIRQKDGAGLGKGYAAMALASYVTPPDEPYAVRAGIVAIAPYYDHVYIAECSSTASSYSNWHTLFMSFFKSVNFKKSYHELAVGNYRNFLKDWGTIDVIYPNAVSRTVY